MNIKTNDANVAEGNATTARPNRPAAIARTAIARQFRARPALVRARRDTNAIDPAAV
jgi:hypothetical protein